MKKNLRIFYVTALFAFLGVINTINVNAQTDPTLMHSYTFEDGTAADVEGGADGTPTGGFINEGVYVASNPGDIITLPAGDIAINEYSAITLEAFVTTYGSNEGNNTMLAYFGGSPAGLGADGYFVQLSRGDGQSRTAISTGNLAEPWTAETGVFGDMVDSEGKHHLVSTLTGEAITWYIDGVEVGSTALADDDFGNSIANLSNEFAWLARGGYANDATWLGVIHEFNIYEGEMESAQVAERSAAFLADLDPTLSALTVSLGDEELALNPDFHPYRTSYALRVPAGTPSVTITATPSNENFTVEGDGVLNLVDGSGTATIEVTADDKTISYTIEVQELSNDASLSAITVMAGEEVVTLEPVFSADVLEYDVEVPAGTTSVSVTATTNNSGARVAGTGAVDVSSGSGTATLVVTAEDETEETYVVNILVAGEADNANLASLVVVQPGVLTPEFDPEVTEYSFVANYRPEGYVNVNVTPAVEMASVEKSRVVELENGTGSATIMVTALDGTTTKEYTIDITMAAPTAVGDEINSTLKVYPTVSFGDFTVELDGAAGKVTVYDLSGKLVVEEAATSGKASVSIPKAGMYIFRVESKGLSKSFKVFKVN